MTEEVWELELVSSEEANLGDSILYADSEPYMVGGTPISKQKYIECFNKVSSNLTADQANDYAADMAIKLIAGLETLKRDADNESTHVNRLSHCISELLMAIDLLGIDYIPSNQNPDWIELAEFYETEEHD